MDQGQKILRVLIVSARCPWPPYTGDRLRVLSWLNALHDHAEVTLVSPGKVRDEYPGLKHVRVRWSPLSLMFAAVRAVRTGLPLHALITAGYSWSRALARAHSGQSFDVAVVMLSRTDPWVRAHVHASRKILDAIDSLGRSVTERAEAAKGLTRIFWRSEARKMTGFESSLATKYDRILLVNPAETAAFGERATEIPLGVRISDVPAERSFDFGFWGRLGFFANRDSAQLLLSTIWPRIRERFPAATLLVAGADAPGSVRRHHGRNGVTVISPTADLRSLIREVRIAIFPIRFGTGQSIKALEAAEAGCAIVATPRALRGVEALAVGAIIEPALARLADHAIALLERPEQIIDMSRRSREAVKEHFSASQMEARMRAIVIGSPEIRT